MPGPLLLFPTHYLGNFVLGMPWALDVMQQHPDSNLVLDTVFRDLSIMMGVPQERVIYYPRREIGKDQPTWHRLRHYVHFLQRLRSAKNRCVVDLEGERFTGVLSRLSGCHRRIGPTGKRAERFYTETRDLDYHAHRFNAFREIASDFVGTTAPSSVFRYRVPQAQAQKVRNLLLDNDVEGPFIVIHPGASVDYKLWPAAHFAHLVEKFQQSGRKVVWIGAGSLDAEMIGRVMDGVPASGVVDLCNKLSVAELVSLFGHASLFIGSDSGPMHLAASTGMQVIALFGPSLESIWAPLGDHTRVLRGPMPCAQECDASYCVNNYHCLTSLTADRVYDEACRVLAADDCARQEP